MIIEAEQHSDSDRGVDPAAWGEILSGVYGVISEHAMRDLPVFNEALSVEAVGFRRYDGNIVGIMVTPWFMNLVLRTADGASRARPALGSSVRLTFPAGDIDFTVSEVASAGRIASCSLFSPMFEFVDMASARATAEAALAALMLPADDHEVVRRGGQPGASAIDRRNFLRGVLTERRG